jgi:CubicO group peptidase (beta-lactamase class C family)
MANMRQCLLILLIISGILFNNVQAQENVAESQELPKEMGSKQGPSDPVELESFLDGIMVAHLESYHIAGATLAIVKDGKIFLAKGYGYADVEKKKPVVADKTLFRQGSVSKLFTWTAVMQLVEQGRLDLNANINRYLKNFKIPDTYPEPITLIHLLTHTPGFEDVINGMAAPTAEKLVPLGEFLASKIPTRIFPPGELTAYSNYGTALAGYIVQEVSGMSFEEYIEEYIFEPLGMEQSTFRQPLPPRMTDDMSIGYTYEKGKHRAQEFEYINGLAPAASMSSAAADMTKFMIAHLQGGKYGDQRILKEETSKLMHSQLFTHDSRVEGNAYGFWEQNLNNLRMIGHEGDTVWFHALLVLIPKENLGIHISYNSTGGAGTARDELIQAFLDRYYPLEELPELKPMPDFKERVGRFAGSYGVTRSVPTTYEKLINLIMVTNVKAAEEGTLVTVLPAGLGTRHWIEVEPLVFHEVGGQDKLVFRENRKGRITHAFYSRFPRFAMVKLDWYERPVFHYSLLAITTLLFLSTLVWPMGALSRVLCRRKKDIASAPWFIRGLPVGMSVFYILFLIGTIKALSNQLELMFGVPSILRVALVFPLISAGLTIGVLLFTYFVWKNKYWSVCGRIHYTLIMLASPVFLWFLNFWNLLGFHF